MRRSIAGYLAALTALTIVLGPLMPSPATATAWTRSSLIGSPSLVRVIDTSKWSPASPDSSAIEYLPASGSLLVADSEVEETLLFAGVNVFHATTGGVLLATSSTTAFSNEPTGTAVNAANGHVFFADDNQARVFEVHVGPDAQYGTADDSVTSFATPPFGNNDPEGLAFGAGKLYITDGTGAEVHVVDPGPNGAFDGVSEGGDDVVTHWDTLSLGQPDPEGIAFNSDLGTLFIVGKGATRDVTEATPEGALVGQIELSFLSTQTPAGLAYGRGSVDQSERVLYLADRGRDSGPSTTNNDGAIFEISLGRKPSVLLEASRRRVQRGDRVRLIARIAPCAGHQGDPIEFYRRGRMIASEASSSACVARVRVRILKTTRFRAFQPDLGSSNRVRIRVKR